MSLVYYISDDYMDFCRQFAFFENCPQIVHKLPSKSPVSALVCNPMTEAVYSGVNVPSVAF